MTRDEDEQAAVDARFDKCGGSAKEFIGREMDRAMTEVFWSGEGRQGVSVPKGFKRSHSDQPLMPDYEWVEVSPGVKRLQRKDHEEPRKPDVHIRVK